MPDANTDHHDVITGLHVASRLRGERVKYSPVSHGDYNKVLVGASYIDRKVRSTNLER
jgi:hypothetical protein